MWLPNIVLGAAGVFLLINRARSADQPIRIPLPQWLTRWRRDDGDAGEHGAAPASTARRPVVRHARAALRAAAADAARHLHRASSTCASSAMTTVGMLGLFYISTFIDMSDKLFKGTDHARR